MDARRDGWRKHRRGRLPAQAIPVAPERVVQASGRNEMMYRKLPSQYAKYVDDSHVPLSASDVAWDSRKRLEKEDDR
jgi:hypothetical protein